MSTIIMCTFFVSCMKKVNCEGTVYSKHGFPVPNVRVSLMVYTTGSDEALPKPFHATTDNNGHFMFSERVNKNRSFGLNCDNDSGYFYKTGLSRDDLKHYDIRY